MNTAKFIIFALVAAIGVAGVSAANNGGAIGSNAGGGGGGGGGGLDEATADGFYLRQDGTETLKGNLLPDGDATRNVGATGSRIQQLWLERVNTSDTAAAGQLTFGGNINFGNGTTPAPVSIRNNLASGSYLTVGSAGTGYFLVVVAAPARVAITATKLNTCASNSASCGLIATGTTHPEVRVTDDAGFCVTTDSGTTCNTTITGTGLVIEAQQAIALTGTETTEPVLNQVSLNCTNGAGCTWDFVETAATAGRRFCASNISANNVTINDGAGVRAVQGAAIVLGENDSACFHYINSLWVQTSLSDN